MDKQIKRSKQHESEIREIMEAKVKEVERDYITLTSHESILK